MKISFRGIESATIPPPALKYKLCFSSNIVLIKMLKSIFPLSSDTLLEPRPEKLTGSTPDTNYPSRKVRTTVQNNSM